MRDKEIAKMCSDAIKAMGKLDDREKKLIREIVEASPNRDMYLGYVPVHFKIVSPRNLRDMAKYWT